jgi:hypothetical protein
MSIRHISCDNLIFFLEITGLKEGIVQEKPERQGNSGTGTGNQDNSGTRTGSQDKSGTGTESQDNSGTGVL